MAMLMALVTFPKLLWTRQTLALLRKLPTSAAAKKSITSYRRTYRLTYSEHGDPEKVLCHEVDNLKLSPLDNCVLVRMLMAPVNPSDLDMISGSYFVHPPMPAIGGNEGVGQVVDIGNAVRKLRPGDWVIPADSGWGTWRSIAVSPEGQLTKIPNDIPVVGAATLAVNPCTAYRMLKGFVKLSPGDYVIQNGANTSVGHAVIQLAKAWGINTISIIKHTQTTHHEHHHTQDCRDKAVVKTLVDLGATHVISDEFFLSEEMNYFAKAIPKPKLALDCEGSPTAKHMEEFLADNAVMVTYGLMPTEPKLTPSPDAPPPSAPCEHDSRKPPNKECLVIPGEMGASRGSAPRRPTRGHSPPPPSPPCPVHGAPPSEPQPPPPCPPPIEKVAFKQVLGYWQSMWSAEHGQNPTMDEMVAELARLMREGQFQVPACDIYTLDMYHIAIKKAKEAQDPKRVLFKIDEELLL